MWVLEGDKTKLCHCWLSLIINIHLKKRLHERICAELQIRIFKLLRFSILPDDEMKRKSNRLQMPFNSMPKRAHVNYSRAVLSGNGKECIRTFTQWTPCTSFPFYFNVNNFPSKFHPPGSVELSHTNTALGVNIKYMNSCNKVDIKLGL